MARAIFAIPFVSGQPQLPPMLADAGGLQLAELIGGKVRDGCGWGMIGPNPKNPLTSCLALVDSSAATIAAMKADTANYVFIEEVIENAPA